MAGELISDNVGREYLKVVTRCLSPWRGHIDFEDLVAYCMLRVLFKLARLPQSAREAAVGLVVTVARAAVSDFMATPQNRLRTTEGRGRPVPTLVPLDERAAPLCVQPDFAPALIHRLWCQAVWQEVRGLMTPEEAHTCRLAFWEEEAPTAIGRRTGVSLGTVQRRAARGLNRYREIHGLALETDGRTLTTPSARGLWARRQSRKKEKSHGKVSPL